MRYLAVLGVVFLVAVARGGDPPVAKSPADSKSAAKDKADGKKRPTTKEEFEALAKQGPLPPWIPFPRRDTVLNDHVHGTVTSVSAEAIEIRPKDKKETIKYPAYTLLVTGAICHYMSDSKCYLLDDVKVGDEVVLGVGTVDKEKGQECFYLSIRRRPGGKIPPSRNPSEPNPYHEEQQRVTDYHDRGEYTPEELKAYEEGKEFNAKKGLPPPPPLPPLPKRTDTPTKKEGDK